ncbi:hypothetical protein [Bradyrhizobium brasilense]|uniref:hypothetical protein n=1 Tax=Bradyrhizobium brasilense TaxID=1419277 RepID=UPI00145707B6|nr:hypothetical protein [Bradyrhizobium brasilense]
MNMVWGWYERSQFGDFFPNGDYVGWEEGLKQYFDEQMSAELRAALNDWHVAYIGEVARKFREDRGLLEPHERPLEFRMEESRKSLGSLLHLTNGVRAVDATLHAIIEKLEPGVPVLVATDHHAEGQGLPCSVLRHHRPPLHRQLRAGTKRRPSGVGGIDGVFCKQSHERGLWQSDGLEECQRRRPSLA